MAYTYNPTDHAVFNKAAAISIAAPLDARSYYYDNVLFKYRPYQSIAEVQTYLNTNVSRRGHFSIFINDTGTLSSSGTFTGGTVKEYWFKDGVTSSHLIEKNTTSGGTGTTSLPWSAITATPTTLAGYGITDAAPVSHTHPFSQITSTPTTLAGYGITDAATLTGSYADPSWITSLAWSKLTGKPTTLSGYGITDSLVPSARTITINGTTLDLSADRSWTISGGATLNSTDDLVEGATNKYYTDARVRAVVLTGLSLVTATAITATDSILVAAGKLQAQVTANLATVNAHIANTSNPHSVTKAQIGLGSVDNTSDANKPISTATQTALNLKVAANSAITGATKTKITYDTKGLVTAGANATTDDITEGTAQYFTTARARASFSPGTGIDITNGVITNTGTSTGGGGGTCFDTLATFTIGLGATTITASTTQYISLGGGGMNGTIGTRIMVMPSSGTLKSFFAFVSGTQGTGALTLTVMKGATVGSITASTLALTIAANTAASTGAVFSNTTNTLAVNAGDLVVIRGVQGTGTSVALVGISMILTNE